MNVIDHRYSKRQQAAALYAAAFVFFLVYSAPHRVHHFFEETKPASHDHPHHHNGNSSHDKSTEDPGCVFQISANRCVFGTTGQVQLLTLTLMVHDLFVSRGSAGQKRFLASILGIRAPPIA